MKMEWTEWNENGMERNGMKMEPFFSVNMEPPILCCLQEY